MSDETDNLDSKEFLEQVLACGIAAYEQLMDSSSSLPFVEDIVRDRFLHSEMKEQEILESCRSILQSMSIGQLILALLATSKDPRRMLAKLKSDPGIHELFIRLLSAWDASKEDERILAVLKKTADPSGDDEEEVYLDSL